MGTKPKVSAKLKKAPKIVVEFVVDRIEAKSIEAKIDPEKGWAPGNVQMVAANVVVLTGRYDVATLTLEVEPEVAMGLSVGQNFDVTIVEAK